MIKNLSWDSQFFGLNVGLYKGKTARKFQLKKFLKEFKKYKFDCVYVFLDPNDFKGIKEAGENKFFLSDIRVIYELPREKWPAGQNSPPYQILHSRDKRKRSQVIGMSGKLSRTSRFYFDPKFRPKTKEMYEIWAEKIMNDKRGAIILSFAGDHLSGFTGCKVEKDIGELVLVYVEEKFRGRGLGEEIIKNGLDWLVKNRAKKIIVKTQARNIVANRLYQKTGFRVAENILIYHVWKTRDEK